MPLSSAVLAISNSAKEFLIILFIVLVPTVPLTIFAWSYLGRQRRRGTSAEREIETGRSPGTPFAAISVVGTAIAVAAAAILLLVIAIRAVAT